MSNPEDDKKRWPSQLFNEKTIEKKIVVKEETKNPKGGITPAGGPFWLNQLFEGKPPAKNVSKNKIQVIKDEVVIYEMDMLAAGEETILGRHPLAEIQLESPRISMFHVGIIKKGLEYFIQDLASEGGTFLNGTRLAAKETVQLRDGYLIELPDFYLKCILPDTPALEGELEKVQAILSKQSVIIEQAKPNISPVKSAIAPVIKQDIRQPKLKKSKSKTKSTTVLAKYCPVMSHLIQERDNIAVWSKGTVILRVADIIDETDDAKTFRLVGDEKSILFSYQPGQFVTFLLNINGQEVQRSYSISSSPSRQYTLEFTVKRVPGGLVSNWLCDNIKLGDKLKVKGPSGKFTCFHHPSNKVMFLAAGSGIAPIMSMTRWLVDTAADIDAKFIASFKTPSEIIFRKELELLSARHTGFRVALTVTSSWKSTEFWTGFTGRINQQMIQIVAPDFQERHIFMCGPDTFMAEMKNLLRKMNFPMANLHSESFTAGRVAAGVETHIENKWKYKVRFTKSGITAKTDGKKSILELAEANGVEIDYSCRAGYCGDCKAKLKGKGKVKVSENAEIDADEKAKGFVYTCCSFPQSDIKVEA